MTYPALFSSPYGNALSVSMILSVILHIVALVIIPILSSIFHNSRTFERPKTFQLVASPLRPFPAKRIPVQQTVVKQRKPQEQKEAIPRRTPDSSVPRKQRDASKQQDAARPIREEIDELSSILDEIPAPAQVSAIGNFKYHWYLNNVQQKLMRYWNPPSENRSINVVISFSINKDGEISEPKISSSSGNGSIDNLALRAVQLAAPFGKLPPGFEGNRLDLNCKLIPTRNY